MIDLVDLTVLGSTFGFFKGTWLDFLFKKFLGFWSEPSSLGEHSPIYSFIGVFLSGVAIILILFEGCAYNYYLSYRFFYEKTYFF